MTVEVVTNVLLHLDLHFSNIDECHGNYFNRFLTVDGNAMQVYFGQDRKEICESERQLYYNPKQLAADVMSDVRAMHAHMKLRSEAQYPTDIEAMDEIHENVSQQGSRIEEDEF